MNTICDPTASHEATELPPTTDSGVRVVRRGTNEVALNANGQSSAVEPSLKTPTPPFWGTRVCHDTLEDVFAYLDEFALVRNRWGFTQGQQSDVEFENCKAKGFANGGYSNSFEQCHCHSN
jgi:cobalamin-dependent methionine synthase I